MKKWLILGIILTVFSFNSFAQINIQGTGKVCLGDLAFFTYSAPSGKTVKSYDWDFGDTYTSTSSAPTHLYKKVGDQTIKLNVSFTGGGSAEEELKIEVLSLPRSSFKMAANTDTCQFSNYVCFTDLSTPANSTQKIVQRAIVWGDGTQTLNKNPGGQSLECHSYQTADKFYVEMEITDNEGCKSYISRYVNILNDVKARITKTIEYPDCETAKICYKNNSSFTTGQKITYAWDFDGYTSTKEHGATDPYCISLTSSKYVSVTLTATTKDGCTSSVVDRTPIEIKTGPRKLTLEDSVFCYGENSFDASVDALYSEQVRWYIDDTLNGYSNQWQYKFKERGLGPGKYTLRCEVERGGCKQTLYREIEIKGPIASMKIFNTPQCGAIRRVFFVQTAKFVDTTNTMYTWKVIDEYGDNCVINRAEDLNKYKNCNTTVGWFAKHDYTAPRSKNAVLLTVFDTVTGCADQILGNVDLNRCGNCKPFEGTIEICQNEMFLPGEYDPENPIAFSLDTGKTWLPFPSKIGPEYAGLYKVGLVYKWHVPEWAEDFGDDSIRIQYDTTTFYDTFFVDDLLYVKKIKNDSVSFEFSTSCSPYELTIRLRDGVFEANEKITIDWGDGESTVVQYTQHTLHKVFKHAYSVPGANGQVRVILFSAEGCTNTFTTPLKFGYIAAIDIKSIHCAGSEVCLDAAVADFQTGEAWTKTNNLGTVSWILDGKKVGSGEYKYCTTFNNTGRYEVAMITKTTAGCVDTTYKTITIQDVKAGITDDSKVHYCRGLREFVDSSVLAVKGSSDYISKYRWDFGTGNFGSWEKNPIQSFDGSIKKIQVKHAVTTNSGCTDTVEFTLHVLTSLPNFELDDSIGCAPHTVNFTNFSKGSTHFIWEFGDEDNATTERTDLSPTKYTYQTPGKYHVRLIGIDSFYNPVTKNIYYCHTVYPDLSRKGLAVIVLPNSHPGLTGPDTLCMGADGVFYSQSDTAYDYDIWKMGDGSEFERSPNNAVVYSYDEKGSYTITLDPVFKGHTMFPKCISKIEKQVEVIEILADFEIDPDSKKPIYDFVNYSKPNNASYMWDFGQSSSGNDNNSSLKHPSHNYKSDSGTFVICLIASAPQGCKDTVCQSITTSYQQFLETYNVFTPGNSDDINDAFVLELIGEDFHDLTIFNRWGEAVYHSEADGDMEALISWDGSVHNSGKLCPAGTYFYVLKYAYAIDPKDARKTNGIITLIRE